MQRQGEMQSSRPYWKCRWRYSLISINVYLLVFIFSKHLMWYVLQHENYEIIVSELYTVIYAFIIYMYSGIGILRSFSKGPNFFVGYTEQRFLHLSVYRAKGSGIFFTKRKNVNFSGYRLKRLAISLKVLGIVVFRKQF